LPPSFFGLQISCHEINLIWPVFDEDGSGVVEIHEFVQFLEQRERGEAGALPDGAIKGLSGKLRQGRIRKKTVFGQQVGGPASCVVTVWPTPHSVAGRACIAVVVTKRRGTTASAGLGPSSF
jgi:hypothetical protein